MTLHYLDSSAWVKRYFEEIGSATVRDLFRSEEPIAVSALAHLEVSAAIARRFGHRGSNSDIRYRAQEWLDSEWGQSFQVQILAEDFSVAVDFARRFNLRGADALHLAIAHRLAGSMNLRSAQLAFWTADHELISAAKSLKIQVRNPVDPSQEQGN